MENITEAPRGRNLLEEDARLALGDRVLVLWTNSNRYYAGRGVIWKLNAKSVVVQLTEPVEGRGAGYPAGTRINAPRIAAATKWSATSNCVIKEDGGAA